jgi:DNA-binding NarL/FixJ family response regulator
VRVIIIDDSLIIREGLRSLLEAEGHQIVDVIGRLDHIADSVTTGLPDVVILDIRMPPTFTDEGVRAAISLRAAMPGVGILVLSQYAIPEYATRLLESGARGTGYLLKDRILEPLQLSQALQRLADGGTVVDPDVVGELITSRQGDDPLNRLSGRERDVLRLMAEGLSDKGIAEQLYVSLNTVGTHVRNIFRKLDLPRGAVENRRVLAVLTALQGDVNFRIGSREPDADVF